MGSCFAENMGAKLADHFFPVEINPFGTLYNPASIAEGLRMLMEEKQLEASDLFFYQEMYHSFTHHSRFSASTQEDCLKKINERLLTSSSALKMADRLVVTFGTAWVYKLKSDGRIVANCHKLPEKTFVRTRLTVDEIVNDWSLVLDLLRQYNPDLKILLTVSPVRHWKDGANENQISKATLILAIEELRRLNPMLVDYFPAYEIMIDELRDYRFYADDMLHPSALAVDYIWSCFADQYLEHESHIVLKELTEIRKALAHKPFNSASEAYHNFLKQTLQKAETLNNKIGGGRLTDVIDELKNKLR